MRNLILKFELEVHQGLKAIHVGLTNQNLTFAATILTFLIEEASIMCKEQKSEKRKD